MIGKGTFGSVFKAKLPDLNKDVAIKKVFQDENFMNRELEIMKELDHPNIVTLYNSYYTKENVKQVYLNLIMEYVPDDLSKIIQYFKKNNKKFPLPLIKLYAYQMLRGIAYVNSKGICHRDIKPQNILVNSQTHEVKICDFGSAKKLDKGGKNISYICSRYYRPPELILEAVEYTTQVDMWSIGCVIAEMFTLIPIFMGADSMKQLNEIISLIGSPTKEDLIAMRVSPKELPKANTQPWNKVVILFIFFRFLNQELIQFLLIF